LSDPRRVPNSWPEHYLGPVAERKNHAGDARQLPGTPRPNLWDSFVISTTKETLRPQGELGLSGCYSKVPSLNILGQKIWPLVNWQHEGSPRITTAKWVCCLGQRKFEHPQNCSLATAATCIDVTAVPTGRITKKEHSSVKVCRCECRAENDRSPSNDMSSTQMLFKI
jgi:hypothetical protein